VKDKIQCALCGKWFTQITATHLKSQHPGVSMEDYRKIYGPVAPGTLSTALARQHSSEIAALVLQEVKKDPTFIQDISRRVGNTLFSEEFRGKVMGTVLMVLLERAGTYKKLAERLDLVEDELYQPHRIEAGGPFGSPTDTETLVQMAKHSSRRMGEAEDAILRILKQTIDDKKATESKLLINNVFTGKHEHIHVPERLDSRKREALRRLSNSILRDPKTVKAVMDKARNAKEEEDDEEIIEAETVS
jgi:hypothetical protein